MTTDDVAQRYAVTVFSTAEGAKTYTATASFFAGTGADAPSVALPNGSTMTLNGVAMTAITSGSGGYSTTGSGNPGTFAFAWTLDGTTYTNTLTATVYTLPTVPTSISKSGSAGLAITGVPVGITVSATVNAGNKIAAPFFALPVQVSGGGTGSAEASNLGALATGAGVLTIVEEAASALQSPTAAGGSGAVTVQFGYNVSIAD
jgi:hypothetical protein